MKRTPGTLAAWLAGGARPGAAAGVQAGRWSRAEWAFWALPVLVWFLLPDYLALGSQVLIMGLFALSLDLVIGYAGIVSLGHAAYFGIGAYVAGILSVRGWGEPITGLLAGAAVAALVGWITSFLVMRGTELARMMVTMGIATLLFELANRNGWLTGGTDGLQGIAMWPLFGAFEFDLFGKTAYCYCLAVCFGLFLLMRRLVHSPFGLSLRGLRENPSRMLALGVSVRRREIAAFTAGAAIAGVAGALLAQTTAFVGLDSLALNRSADALVMLVLGGVGRLYGGLVGALVFMVVHDWLSGLNPIYWQLWMGLLLIAIVMAGRGGVLGVATRLAQWRASRRPGGSS